jgi:hypothetical protein
MTNANKTTNTPLASPAVTVPAVTDRVTALPVKDAAHAAKLAEKIDRFEGDVLLSPAHNAAQAIIAFGDKPDDYMAAHLSLADKVARMAESLHAGDMADVEALLIAQASALNAIFTTYCLRSAHAEADARRRGNTDPHALPHAATRPDGRPDQLLLLALKAQAASRATLDTLVNLKFPRTTVIARQANVANQQINNSAAGTPSGGWDHKDGPRADLEAGGTLGKANVSNSSVGRSPRARARNGAPR